MLAIQPSSKSQKCTPNVLPARLNHDGPINEAGRYWTPQKDEKGTSHTYFRGRHLQGTSLALPANYTGAVLHVTDKLLPTENPVKRDAEDENGEEGESDTAEVKMVEKIGEFEEVVVWGHGAVVDETADEYTRGLTEWIGFAEAMHGEEEKEQRRQNTG